MKAATLSAFVIGAQNYATEVLHAALSSGAIDQMTSYATAQLAQVASDGRASYLQGNPVAYSHTQLSVDVAAYGAAASGAAPQAFKTRAKTALTLKQTIHRPPSGTTNCGGGTLAEGQSCSDAPSKLPSKDPKNVFTADSCKNLSGHQLSGDGKLCYRSDRKACPSPIPNPFGTPGPCSLIPVGQSIDPNEKDGPVGPGAAQFTLGRDSFPYQIGFENQATASLPAQTVVVTDQLDTTHLDLSTLSLGPIGFGNYLLTPVPGSSNFAGALDLRPAQNLIVRITTQLDASSGVLKWTFTSLDPATLQQTTDVTAGFLPPDTAPPAGQGHVLYTIRPKPGIASGTTICNSASIVFDTNAPIATNRYCNQLDAAPPTSRVAALGAAITTPTFTVQWGGSDAGSGIASYTIYSATDVLGNAEAAKTMADATTEVDATSPSAAPDFAISTDMPSMTVAAGQTAQAQITVTPGQRLR